MTSCWIETLTRARGGLLAQAEEAGHWRGHLSSSALSTATAVAALLAAREAWPERAPELERAARAGQGWLAEKQGQDGGFGDTVASPSNLSTTALAWMALGLDCAGHSPDESVRVAAERAEAWLSAEVTALDGPGLSAALEAVYGDDRTFAVPILMALAAGGRLGAGDAAWAHVPRLPFELAALPQGLFRFAGLPVVSYALPALIAIGQAIEHRRPSRNPLARAARLASRRATLRRLEQIQPSGGGFLEATPLTSFVALALCTAEEARHPVVGRCCDFLLASMRPDGSWPIDTDLATWGTTLSVGALGAGSLAPERRGQILTWLLDQQLAARHPYTGAAAGGWAWTDLPGGVPDADDTSGAVLALAELQSDGGAGGERVRAAAERGLVWLRDLQNRDGGIPTFCRGWGRLPFDQSCADLTAHALRAMEVWRGRVGVDLEPMRSAAVRFLITSQEESGAWLPLWFGNQDHPAKHNPVYGTSRVLRAARVRPASGRDAALWNLALRRGLGWLLGAQHPSGGFGGDVGIEPSIEETGLALEALADAYEARLGGPALRAAGLRAAEWLSAATEGGLRFAARPIGLYFAQLWYDEELYPRIYCASGLGRAREVWGS